MNVADEHRLIRDFINGATVFEIANKYGILVAEVETILREELKVSW